MFTWDRWRVEFQPSVSGVSESSWAPGLSVLKPRKSGENQTNLVLTLSVFVQQILSAYYVLRGLPWWLRQLRIACNGRDQGSIPGLGRSPGGGHGNPLQYSCLENPMDGGAWWAMVHRAATSRTRLKRLGAHAHMQIQARPQDAVVSKPGVVPALGGFVASVGTMPLKRFLRLRTKTKLLTALSRGPLGSQASWAHGPPLWNSRDPGSSAAGAVSKLGSLPAQGDWF